MADCIGLSSLYSPADSYVLQKHKDFYSHSLPLPFQIGIYQNKRGNEMIREDSLALISPAENGLQLTHGHVKSGGARSSVCV